MKAVILAGGFGTRLRPLTLTRPKPMIPLVNKPVIEHVVDYLAAFGFTDIVVTTTFSREMVVEHFRNRDDVHLTFPPEPVPLGSAGSVKNAGLEKEAEPFVVIQGDNITNMDLRGLVDFHFEAGGLVTIAFTHVEDPWNYGIAQLEANGCIVRFREKPAKGECFSDLASTGIYVVDPEALDFVPEKIPFDFAKDLFHLLHAKKKGSMFGYELGPENFWADVGQPEGFLRATEWMLKSAGRDVMMGENVEITSSGILGPAVIGNSVVVEENCTVGPHTVLFDDVYIARNSTLEQCLIGERTVTGENACIKDAIIGAHCELGKDVAVYSGKIWPYVTIPDNTTVDSAIKRYVCFRGGEEYGGDGENEDLFRAVPDEEAFYFNMHKAGKLVHTGFVAHSLREFIEILDKVDLKAIEYHLREGCNDFAAWIRDVFRHPKLAEEVAPMRWWWPRKKMISGILKRLSEECSLPIRSEAEMRRGVNFIREDKLG